jgi:nitrogen fixation protein NifU and related proteins
MELSREMYQEHILDLYKDPSNRGALPNPTHKSHSFNPLCGDDITINLLTKNDKVEQVKFEGKGCAISIASASMVTDKIKGMTVSEIMKLKKEDVLDMLQIEISPVRLKCALISLETVHNAINKIEDNIIGDEHNDTA